MLRSSFRARKIFLRRRIICSKHGIKRLNDLTHTATPVYHRAMSNKPQEGFRTRVFDGVTDNVVALYHKANSVFPLISEDDTGFRFAELETFMLADDACRTEKVETHTDVMKEWKAKNERLLAQVQSNNEAIATSHEKITAWKKLIKKEERNIEIKKDEIHDCMGKIDDVSQNIRDVTPGLEVMTGIVRFANVLFSAPRMESRAALAETYHVDSKKALKDTIGTDKVLAQNCARSLFTCAAHLHKEQGRLIRMTFTQIDQKGIDELVEVCSELLGFKPKKDMNRRGLLAPVITRRRSLSNERKRKMRDDDDEPSRKTPRL